MYAFYILQLVVREPLCYNVRVFSHERVCAMSITLMPIDILYFIIGLVIGLLIPHGRRYASRAYGSYRSRYRRY